MLSIDLLIIINNYYEIGFGGSLILKEKRDSSMTKAKQKRLRSKQAKFELIIVRTLVLTNLK